MECAASTDASVVLDSSLDLHPQVALRHEPFGALAYHYDTRKLVFLKHPDVVRVVRSLADHATVADALAACEIDEAALAIVRQSPHLSLRIGDAP